MYTILISNEGLESLQSSDTLEMPSNAWTPTAVFDTATTQNGTYEGEPAYEGAGYWVFYSGNYWCKAASKTTNHCTANIVSLELGAHGGDLDNNGAVAVPVTDGTNNYFGDLTLYQAGFFEEISCHCLHVTPGLIFDNTTNTLSLNTFGDIAASFSIFVDGSCISVFPTTGADKQAVFDYGILVGNNKNTDTVNDSINYADNSNNFAASTLGGVEGNCQTLNAIGQANSVCQLVTNNIEAIGTSVNADEVIYDNNYVRTSVNFGMSSFSFTADDDIYPVSSNEGDLFFREDRRSLVVNDGENWLVPTEAFPKYSNNDWDAFKLAWGRVAPRYASASFVEPRITEISGTYGTYSGVRWQAIITLNTGDIVALPRGEANALRLDITDDSIDTSINCTGNNGIIAAAYYNDVIYAYSVTASEIIKIDPSDNSVVQCTSNMSGTYTGGVLYNDYIYFAQETPNSIVKFDPSDNSTETISYTGNTFTPNQTVNMCLAADNCMYILPYREDDFIIKFDPSDDSFTEVDIDLATVNTADKRWAGFVSGPDGCMYITPTDSGDEGAVYNPFTGEWSELTGDSAPTADAYLMGAAHPSGKIVFGPGGDTDAIFIIDTATKVGEIVVKPAAVTVGQHYAQLAGNGHVYCFPGYQSGATPITIWKIELGETLPLDYHFATSIYIDA